MLGVLEDVLLEFWQIAPGVGVSPRVTRALERDRAPKLPGSLLHTPSPLRPRRPRRWTLVAKKVLRFLIRESILFPWIAYGRF